MERDDVHLMVAARHEQSKAMGDFIHQVVGRSWSAVSSAVGHAAHGRFGTAPHGGASA